ncbi:MAG: hypothetical protein PHS14_20475 [Elusimicrobia bacterium]|nr:hypothetical protein [Elusimicrobiota bacterium]
MPTTIKELTQVIIDRIEARGKKFLDENQGAREFIYERAQRLATLGVTYAAASDDATREDALERMESVRQSIENELSAVAVNASVAAREEFLAIVNMAVEFLRGMLPVLVGLFKR